VQYGLDIELVQLQAVDKTCQAAIHWGAAWPNCRPVNLRPRSWPLAVGMDTGALAGICDHYSVVVDTGQGPVFHRQSNQIWSPTYWSPINLTFRIDHWSTVFRFSMHFRSPITWSAISWSAVNWAYSMPIGLADNGLNLRCCAKLPSMCCEWTP